MPEEATKDYFEEAALKYIKFAQVSETWQTLEMPALYSCLKTLDNSCKVLDLGTGTGRVLGLLLDLGFSPKNIYAVDNSSTILAYARENYPQISLFECDLRYLDEQTLSVISNVQLVTANMVLNSFSIADLELTFSLLNNLMSKGGSFVFTLPEPQRKYWQKYTADSNVDPWQELVWLDETPWGTLLPYYCLSREVYKTLLEKTGFANIQIYSVFLDEDELLEVELENSAYTFDRNNPVEKKRILITATKD